MNKEKVLQILEENIYNINALHKTAININQSGTLNREKLEREKKRFFMYLTDFFINDIITEKQYYPENDISEVDFNADFVILKKDDYNSIKEYIEGLITKEDLMNHE